MLLPLQYNVPLVLLLSAQMTQQAILPQKMPT